MHSDSVAASASAGQPIAEKVKAQLARDYPADGLAWVDSLTWVGPAAVRTDLIDRTSGDWSAASNKRKVAEFAHRIAKGWRKAVVLVRAPGSPGLYAVDGHTRILACMSLAQPVTAWVGTAKTADGPWRTLHGRQNDDGNG